MRRVAWQATRALMASITPVELSLIIAHRERPRPTTWGALATMLHRPWRSVQRCYFHHLTATQDAAEADKRSAVARVRVCLGVSCGERFRSAGPGNRMCDTCRGRSVSTYEPDGYEGIMSDVRTDHKDGDRARLVSAL